MKKFFASPKKIPAHFLKKDGVESFDLQKAYPKLEALKRTVDEVIQTRPESVNLGLDEFIELMKEPFVRIYSTTLLMDKQKIATYDKENRKSRRLTFDEYGQLLERDLERGYHGRGRVRSIAEREASKLHNNRTTVANILRNLGVRKSWFDVLHKMDKSDSWLDILKLTYRDGSVASMPNFKEFSDDLFQDTKTPKSQKGAIFRTKEGLVVIVRPHFNAQAGKYSRVGNHRDYPLKDVVLAIEQNMPTSGEHNSFVSAGKKNKEGEGNVDATLSYTIQRVTDKRVTGSGLLNKTVGALLTDVYDDKELKDFANAKKVLVLNSAHGFKEWKKQPNKKKHNIWPDTWEGTKQFQDRQKRLGGKK